MYCDAHIHLLPGMDNGPQTTDEAVEMLCSMREHDVRQAILCPHFDPSRESVAVFLRRRTAAYHTLEDALFGMRGLPFVILSAEVLFQPGVSRIAAIERLLIPGTRILPIELPLTRFEKWMMPEFVHLMHKRKIRPMICQTERYMVMYPPDDYARLASLPETVFCLSAQALTDISLSHAAFRLIHAGKDVVISSNAHNATTRPPVNDETEESIRLLHGATVYRVLSMQTRTIFHEAFSG